MIDVKIKNVDLIDISFVLVDLENFDVDMIVKYCEWYGIVEVD